MTQDNAIKLTQPGTFSDPLTEILRNGARALLAHAVEAEVAGFLGDHADKLTADGRARLVRHGHLPASSREAPSSTAAIANSRRACAASFARWAKRRTSPAV